LSRCTGCIEKKNSGSSSEEDRIIEDSIELCQEGIEHRNIVQRRTPLWVQGEIIIIEDFGSSSRRALSRC
jgi:hypothetical protein